MHIGLIVPPSGFMLDDRVFPTLGILKVAASLERAGHEVTVFDLTGGNEGMAFNCCEVIGFTATTPEMPFVAAMARAVHEDDAPIRLVLGGPHVTLMNAAAKAERARAEDGRACRAMRELAALFDVLVCGDGERSVLEAIQPNAPALIDADDRKSSLFLTKADLQEQPLPARHLIDLQSYHFTIADVPTTSLIAQLGCPFGCHFCGGRRSPFLRTVRTRPTASILAEIEHLHTTYGYRGFMFLDDELNVSPAFSEMLTGLCQLQERLGVDFVFRGLLKSELFTPEMAHTMRGAGFRDILIGFESGDERMLLNMNKHATRDDNTRAVEYAKSAGLRIKALMSLGHPGESEASIAHTREWLLEVQPDEFDATVITVYPGTPYHDDAKETAPGVWTFTTPKTGDCLHSHAIDQFTDTPFYKGIPGQYQAYVWTDQLSAPQLVAARDELESEVRAKLNIAWPAGAAALQFEHSMGMR